VESCEVLEKHLPILLQFALETEPHLLIQHFASRCAIRISDSNELALTEEIKTRLQSINRSPYPILDSNIEGSSGTASSEEAKAQEDEPSYRFDDDILEYWFRPIIRCFNHNLKDFQKSVENVIRKDWLLGYDGRWSADARHPQYEHDEISYHQTSHPKTDTLDFYLSYHAMMVAAAKLLVKKPVLKDSYTDTDRLTDWFKYQVLTRPDGRWLADRVDPAPLERRKWKEESENSKWRWLITPQDFEICLGLNTPKINLSGKWITSQGYREETINIESALISTQHSKSFVRACDSTSGYQHCFLPDAKSEHEIQKFGFQLKGIVIDEQAEHKLDRFDPWSYSIKYPGLTLAKFITEQFHLISDVENRIWKEVIAEEMKEVCWSQVWGREQDEYLPRECGRRMQIDKKFLQKILATLDLSIVLRISISRSFVYGRYDPRTSEEKKAEVTYVPPYCQHLLIGPDGRLQ